MEELDKHQEKNQEIEQVIKQDIEQAKEQNMTQEIENDNSSAKTNQKTKLKFDLKKIIETTFQTRIFILVMIIILLLKTILFYKITIFRTEKLEFPQIYMALVFIGVLFTIPMMSKSKLRFWLALIIDLLVSILLLINEIYYSYSTNLVSISQISNLQYGKEISASLPYLLKFRQILYIVDIIIILILNFALKIKNKKQPLKAYIPGVVYLIFISILGVIPINSCLINAYNYQYNKILQIEASSIYGYYLLDISNNLNMKKNVKYKTKSEMMTAYNELKSEYDDKYTLEYDFTEIAKDKNVIVLQLESVQNFVVNRTINGKEITPNLNKFLNENINFTNMQNQSYSSTADAEFTVMNSIYPLENGMCFAQYPSNDYDNIFLNFKEAGYSTLYIHGNEGGFWNRNAVYSRLSIDNLMFDDVFDENVERVYDYVSDEQVYRKVVDELKKSDGKFFANIVAASSHTSFDLPGLEDKYKKVNIDVGDNYRGIYFGNYLEAVNYADYAFGIFIDELKKADLYDDTVIIIYGDHAGLQMYNWEMQDFIRENQELNDIQTQINYSNVLCGMKIPGVSSMKITKPTSRLDVKPTLAEICGVEDHFSLGESMFSNKEFVCINTGRIITDKYFYNGNWYEIETGEEINRNNMPQEEINKLQYYEECMKKELDISLSINILNLLKK